MYVHIIIQIYNIVYLLKERVIKILENLQQGNKIILYIQIYIKYYIYIYIIKYYHIYIIIQIYNIVDLLKERVIKILENLQQGHKIILYMLKYKYARTVRDIHDKLYRSMTLNSHLKTALIYFERSFLREKTTVRKFFWKIRKDF